MEHVPAPAFGQSGHVGEPVGEPGGHQDPARAEHASVGQDGPEAVLGVALDASDPARGDLASVGAHLGAAAFQEFGRGDPLQPQQAVHPARGGVARLSAVHHQDRASGPGQGERSAQAGGSPADHQYLVDVLVLRVHMTTSTEHGAPSPGIMTTSLAGMAT